MNKLRYVVALAAAMAAALAAAPALAEQGGPAKHSGGARSAAATTRHPAKSEPSSTLSPSPEFAGRKSSSPGANAASGSATTTASSTTSPVGSAGAAASTTTTTTTTSTTTTTTTTTTTGTCDPLNPAAICGGNQHCVPQPGGVPTCEGPTGGGTAYSACVDRSDCGPVYECVSVNGICSETLCMQWCTSWLDCGGMYDDCYSLDPAVYVGGQEWGICYDCYCC